MIYTFKNALRISPRNAPTNVQLSLRSQFADLSVFSGSYKSFTPQTFLWVGQRSFYSLKNDSEQGDHDCRYPGCDKYPWANTHAVSIFFERIFQEVECKRRSNEAAILFFFGLHFRRWP
ncbi:hypothetical protein SAMN05192573_110197 [Mucilaginibacter gossypii]|uniref:Uncharacterized protein n=1 Tax=Mucilaginibacter gossypii TaxID=551996 RepID=A0A1G8DDU5_9SPHI|nr:hypothetical protein SAMN05192573_110197 [Mucilaginibacter gossypii]